VVGEPDGVVLVGEVRVVVVVVRVVLVEVDAPGWVVIATVPSVVRTQAVAKPRLISAAAETLRAVFI